MTSSVDAPTNRQPRWYAPTAVKFLTAVLLMQGVLFLSSYYRWFWFNERKGFTVLIAVAATAICLLLLAIGVVVSWLLRTRVQFGLATLLLLVPVMAIPFAWMAQELEQANQQKFAGEQLKLHFGRAIYKDPHSVMPFLESNATTKRLVTTLGADFFRDLQSVLIRPVDGSWINTRDTKVRHLLRTRGAQIDADAVLHEIKDVECLEELNAHATNVTDAGCQWLAELKSLKDLELDKTEVTGSGLQHLRGLNNLQRLSLWNTQVGDDGLEHLANQVELRVLDLSGTLITDGGLRHLTGLTKLERLDLPDQISNRGVESLRQSLGSCRIFRSNAEVP